MAATKTPKRKLKTQQIEVLETPEAKQEKLGQAMDSMTKAYGKHTLRMIDTDEIAQAELEPDVISFDIPQMDRATNAGGIPRGKIIEIMGPESSGKTTSTLYLLGNLLRIGEIPGGFIDAEHALDLNHAKSCGATKFANSQPDSGEEAFDVVGSLLPICPVIVVDSVAALVPKAEIIGGSGDGGMAAHARMMSERLKKLVAPASKHRCSVIFINQLRSKVGIVFGNPEVTTGGNALKFYASIRLDFRKKDPIKVGDNVIGHIVQIKTIKSKCSVPYGVELFYMYFNGARTIARNYLEFCVKIGKVEKAGAWYRYKDQPIGQGPEAATDALVENPKLLNELRTIAKENLFAPYVVVEGNDDID